MTPTIYLAYIKARKQHTVITNPNLNEITGSGIYVYDGSLTIDSNSTPFNRAYNIVLVTTGTMMINPALDGTFTPAGSVAIIANQIIFGSTVSQATGIFIANNITTSTNSAQGLKIVGNLIAQQSLTNDRSWADLNMPSLFIKFDPTQYINLFSYLSTANYQEDLIQ
jgi:hypothetical protein